MRNSKFVRYSVVLLGLVVLRTKAQNGFCLMCTKECCMVPTCSKPFWGQFWGQICETDSHTHRLNTCAALVSLRNMNTSITGFLPVKSPKNQYISFSLQQEVIHKHYSAALLHTAPSSPPLGLSYPRTPFPVQALPRRVSPVQEKPAQINNQINRILKKKIRVLSYLQNIEI